MKIAMFDTREDEIEAAEKWSHANNVKVTMYQEPLSLKNVHLLEGFDGLSTSQTASFEEAIYAEIAKRGIKQIAQRSAGFDMVNLEKAAEHHLIVSNVPSYSPNAIAEMLYLLLFTLSGIPLLFKKT